MDNQIIFVFGTAILLWLSVLSFFLYQSIGHYHRLTSGTGKGNIEQILNEILNKLEVDKKNISGLEKALDDLKIDSIYHFQKVGLLRFNPFENTGGDQSFILALMDGADTGIILTSLHSRGTTRWYAKNIDKGKGTDFELSEEEEKTIKQAINLRAKKEKVIDIRRKTSVT